MYPYPYELVSESAGRMRRSYVPHSDRSSTSVIKRNERERKRMESLNGAFKDLQRRIPLLKRAEKRIPKEKILRGAIAYINHLSDILRDGQNITVDENAPGLGEWCSRKRKTSDEESIFDLKNFGASEETIRFIESLAEVSPNQCHFDRFSPS
ncbi:unnamed protein product [Dimorphilus gyrociliatus]|uniref:BHLH domain-containing protein n=1 Tax=Dimorphilus gyrociliatus TaxID=2664684 RepID=A0A7I8VZA6_9ANNE|nr:unnamed protein product [Dimorphilus gyrociliatus]